MFSRWEKGGGRLEVLDGALPACGGVRASATASDFVAAVGLVHFVVVGLVFVVGTRAFSSARLLRSGLTWHDVILPTLLLELACESGA